MNIYAKWFARIFIIAAALNFIIEAVSRKSLTAVMIYLFAEPYSFIMNIMIIMLPFTLIYLTRRKIFACILISLIWTAMGLINSVLLMFRTTPFTAIDLKMVKYAFNMLTTYFNWAEIISVLCGSAAAVILCITVWKKAPVDKHEVRYGVSAVIIAGCIILVVGMAKIGMKTGLMASEFGNIGQAYNTYGFPFCFSNSLFNTGIDKPDDYDSETMAAIKEEELVPENNFESSHQAKPNIIMLQLESFFDPALWKDFSSSQNPIPFFRYLKDHYPSGFLNVPSVGAGTANTEFEAITGMNLDFFGPGEYPYKTVLKKTSCESMAFILKDSGYRAHAIHNNEATFYDRHYVFSQLGFDTFTPIEYMKDVERNPNGWCKDKILTGEILKALNSTAEADFVYTISVQGHGAYPDFEYYSGQIHEMDLFIGELVSQLSERKEPTVLVLYGDHLPGFEWTEDDMVNGSLYQTEYVIWNNMNLPAVKKELESYQLSAYLLDMLGIHEGTMMRFHQNYLDQKITKEKKADYLEAMEALEYDILYGSHQIYEGGSPYQATELQMGIEPVSIEKIVINKQEILVYGRNFTPYSKICLDGKAVETSYVRQGLIIADNLPGQRAQDAQVSVRQIGRDKIALGEEITGPEPESLSQEMVDHILR